MTGTLSVGGVVSDAAAVMSDYSAVIGAASVLGLAGFLLRRLVGASRS